jgi:hypothetical protein
MSRLLTDALERLLDEMVTQQRTRVLDHARRLNPADRRRRTAAA